jgi:hypothetical protein
MTPTGPFFLAIHHATEAQRAGTVLRGRTIAEFSATLPGSPWIIVHQLPGVSLRSPPANGYEPFGFGLVSGTIAALTPG